MNKNQYLQRLKETRVLREQKVKIPVEHPGVLEVPEGKNVEDLPEAHFKALIAKKGWEEISRALTNLHTWNKEKNPTLSAWANKMQETLGKDENKEEVKEDYEFDKMAARTTPGNRPTVVAGSPAAVALRKQAYERQKEEWKKKK